MILNGNKLIVLFCAAMISITALCFTLPVRAAESEQLAVTTAWLEGDVLRIEVKDSASGAISTVELRLSDYADNCETISIQAVDESGNKSGVIRISNPNYVAPVAAAAKGGDEPANSENAKPNPDTPIDAEAGSDTSTIATYAASESAIPAPGNGNPFTPPGTGSVIDTATEQEGKEFFTIDTEDGSVFFLVVDRQKTGENVYLLTPVAKSDLVALAEPEGGEASSAIPDPEQGQQTEPLLDEKPDPEPEPQTKDSGSGSLLLIILAAVAAGVGGYYFKIYKPRQQAIVPEPEDDDPDDDFDEEDEMEWEDSE